MQCAFVTRERCVAVGELLLEHARDSPQERWKTRMRRSLCITGWLCLAGPSGPVVGNVRLQLVGVFRYAVLLPIVAWMLSRWFRAQEQQHPRTAA